MVLFCRCSATFQQERGKNYLPLKMQISRVLLVLIKFSTICAIRGQFDILILKSIMKRGKKNSKLLIDSPSEDEPINQEYVEVQRKKKTKGKNTSKTDTAQDLEQDVMDIHHGDKFVREHIRPPFLKRWDGQSNTLDLRIEQIENLSPMLKVYWQYKCKNMNCVIFVMIGRVEFFAIEDDAIRLHEIFKKPLKRFSSFLMVNFWSKQIELAKVELFQRKIPVLMLTQVEDEKYKSQHGIFKREITEVITPSVFLTMEPKKFRQRMMLAIYSQPNLCGVACVDVETNHFYLEYFREEEGDNIHQIRRIINKYRPAQMIVQKRDQLIKKIAKQICQPYIIESEVPAGSLLQLIKSMRQVSEDEMFGRMQGLYNKENFASESEFSLYPVVKVLNLILSYMKNMSLEAKIFGQGIFQLCDFDALKLKPMFDAQVYENLQVFNIKDEQDSFGKPGTLYHYLNHCVTNSGQKLLKKWIDEPLRTVEQISRRQIAIQNLLQNKGEILNLQKQLIAFEKLQRRVGGIYHWALKHSEEGKIILTKEMKFDKDYDPKKNPAVLRIEQIYQVLKTLQNTEQFFSKMTSYRLESQLLRKNSTIVPVPDLQSIDKNKLRDLVGLPSIRQLTTYLLSNVEIDQHSGYLEPRTGISEVFDFEKQRIEQINVQLREIMSEWKEKLGVSKIAYVSIRARNEIQVPLSEIKNKKFPELIFSSQTSKSIRYVTAKTNQLSQQLATHQQALALAYQPFAMMMVKQFCTYKHIWDLYINAIARIDVLMSLAKTSATMVPRCLPIFTSDRLQVQNGYHPGLLQVKARESVIGNTLKLSNGQKFLLLTGPNMGGKSTLLRQTCLLAILAQIGCYVPCQKYQSIVFDQVFCRIGASDRIIEGKSTFYVQLQQTKRIIDQATPHSLVIIDQLGRGTSTYDGMALASSILKYLTEQIQCYTLFSTHYFPLTQQYASNPRILCGRIGYNFDPQSKEIKFTYQLQPGIAQKSFANQVASQVGISAEALALAEAKAEEIQVTNRRKDISQIVSHRNAMREIQLFLEEGL